MFRKSIAGHAALIAFAALSTTLGAPFGAQQGPLPGQPNPGASQAAPATPQPSVPGGQATPPVTRPPVLPRRIPAPAQAPGAQAAPPLAPQAQGQTPAGPTPQLPGPPVAVAPQETAAPTPPIPQRRAAPAPSFPSGGMVSLNFNRADLVEIIHIIAQQLRLTYTIDPDVKGTVTINSAEPLRPEDLLPVFHQLLRMNGAVAVRTGNLYHIAPIKDGKGLARPLGQGREDSFALQIIPVRFFSVAEMKKVL
ncbi:MAG: hypothetical protein ACREPG_08695, partial [Candidatus Binatia bacterium]